jgi:putative PIN family toxin of toxin-antitoxin system
MRAVVDTNILIRALIKPSGTVGPVLARLAAGDYVQVYSDPVLSELVAKLALPRIRKKYAIDGSVIEGTLSVIALRGELVAPTRKLKVCRDPKDDLLIEAAVAGNAEYVVSDDQDLLVLKKIAQARFVTPRAFLEALDKA